MTADERITTVTAYVRSGLAKGGESE